MWCRRDRDFPEHSVWVALSLEDSVVVFVTNCARVFVVGHGVAIVTEASDAQ